MLTGTLLQRLEYIPSTGDWWWREPPPHNPDLRNRLAGYVRNDGYRLIRIHGAAYYASRLAFVWMLGRWPLDEVDHKDRDPSNDKWDNLRDATSSDNKFNRDLGYHNSYRGVYRSGDNTWWANAGSVYLGTYNSLEEAVAAREKALQHNEFAHTDETLLRKA